MRRGSTTSSNIRSCDTVAARGLFSPSESHVPRKKCANIVVSIWWCQHPGYLPHFIVVHPQVGFAFFTALFNRPAHAAEPDKRGSRLLSRGITLPGSNREIFGVKELHLTSQLVVRCLRK